MNRIFVSIYIGIAVLVVFGPPMYRASSHFFGFESVDHYGTQWFYWFAEYHLKNALSPAHTDLFFYPWGKDIYGHTGANLLDAYAAVPFRVLFGPVLGYNLFVLAGLIASSLAFERLCRRYVPDRLVTTSVAVLFAINPYVLYELAEGRPTQAILLFPVLFVDAMFRSAEQPGYRAPILAGLWLALTGYQYWYYAFFGGILALGYGLWVSYHSPERARTLLRFVAMGGVALLLCAPVAAPMVLATMEEGTVPGLMDMDQWTLTQASPITEEGIRIGMFLFQPLTGGAGFFLQDQADVTERFLHTLYPLPIFLLPAALLWLRRPTGPSRGGMVIMGMVTILVAAGPIFVVLDKVFPNVFYMLIAYGVRFFRRLWWPGRMVGFAEILAFLPLAIVVGNLARKKLILASCLGWQLVWMVWMVLAPMQSWSATVPTGYQCLSQGSKGAIVELPYAWTQAHLYYQTVHEHPIFGGMIEDNSVFAPQEFTDFRTKNTFIASLLELAKLDDMSTEITPEDRQAVQEKGYTYVVLQKDAYAVSPSAPAAQVAVNRTRLRRLERELEQVLGRPVFSDTRTAIYAPFGDPPPCDPHSMQLDRESVMNPNVDPVTRIGIDPDDYIVTWFYGGPSASDSDSAP